LDQAVDDIKRDFQTLLKNNKVILENAYTERIEQVKTQITTFEANKQQETPLTSRVSVETLHDELKQIEKTRDNIENDYRPLIDLYITKQKEKNQIDEERVHLDTEYNRLISEINQLTEAIEVGKQYWFSVHFELETYRRLLDLEITNTTTSNHVPIPNGKQENGIVEEQRTTTIKKTDSQRAISKTGKIT
jgi:archaellum component FlaC